MQKRPYISRFHEASKPLNMHFNKQIQSIGLRFDLKENRYTTQTVVKAVYLENAGFPRYCRKVKRTFKPKVVCPHVVNCQHLDGRLGVYPLGQIGRKHQVVRLVDELELGGECSDNPV